VSAPQRKIAQLSGLPGTSVSCEKTARPEFTHHSFHPEDRQKEANPDPFFNSNRSGFDRLLSCLSSMG
jgi:hypothetical protein